MATERNTGGITGKGEKNINPIYRQMQRFSSYYNNIVKEYDEQRVAKNSKGVHSPEYKEATRQVQGAVFQGRRYKD